MADWTIIIAKPNGEEIAERALREAGYRVYLPRYRRMLFPHGGGRAGRPVMRLLIPGYVFVNDWRGWPTLTIRGVNGIMRYDGNTACLGDCVVREMMGKEYDGEYDESRSPRGPGTKRDDLTIGQAVAVEHAGTRIIGSLTRLDDDGRAILTAMLMGREVRVRVDQEALENVAVA